MEKRIYLDNAATTRVDERVLDAMMPFLRENYGSASSLFYEEGMQAGTALEQARVDVARILGVDKEEIIFTSGGTEAANLAILGTAESSKGKEIITTRIEHPAVLDTCESLEKGGYKVHYLEVDRDGFVNPSDIEKAMSENTALVTIGHANIEIGTIQPVEEIGEICRKHKVLFHVHASQTIGHVKFLIPELNADLVSFSAHRFYGPKGVGALYVKNGTKLSPVLHGGGHEHGLRSGTENIAGIVGLAKALEIAYENLDEEAKRVAALRGRLVDEILKIDNTWLNGPKEKRLPGNANFGFKYIEGEAIILSLNMKNVAASTGSACSSKNLKASHVLLGIGQKQEYTHGSVRFSIGRYNTEEDIDHAITALKEVVEALREMSPYGKGGEDY